MTDQPNLRQFIDEIGSFDEAGAASPKKAAAKLPSIGHVVEIAGSGSQARLDPVVNLLTSFVHLQPTVEFARRTQVGAADFF